MRQYGSTVGYPSDSLASCWWLFEVRQDIHTNGEEVLVWVALHYWLSGNGLTYLLLCCAAQRVFDVIVCLCRLRNKLKLRGDFGLMSVYNLFPTKRINQSELDFSAEKTDRFLLLLMDSVWALRLSYSMISSNSRVHQHFRPGLRHVLYPAGELTALLQTPSQLGGCLLYTSPSPRD